MTIRMCVDLHQDNAQNQKYWQVLLIAGLLAGESKSEEVIMCLAELLDTNLSRETLNNCLERFKKEGLVEEISIPGQPKRHAFKEGSYLNVSMVNYKI